MRTKSVARVGLVAFLVIALSSAGLAQERIVDGVLVRTGADAFTDASTALLVTNTIGAPLPGEGIGTRTYTQAECENGTLAILIFQFDEYLGSAGFGTLQYRVDGGTVRSTEVFISGSAAVLWHSSSGSGNDDEVIRQLLAGSEVAVRAESRSTVSEAAVYDLANFGDVMTRVGCRY